ncbi:hypothetical protein SASPL_113603 [Salvia splendens]|uniref:RNase H type-1 domain-containing protein n=1 Tax=Salvia splendens TaxID=180675 RepID=A0A8X8Y1X1_SALSN|nr:hypothetical protein SASPL_113603 [Salvia splendens]
MTAYSHRFLSAYGDYSLTAFWLTPNCNGGELAWTSKCRCCRAPSIETREHLFLYGEVAAQVWGAIEVWFPNLPRWNVANTDLEKRIKFWHHWLCRTDKPHASSIIPCLVLWAIWSERNGQIHRGALFTAESVLSQVTQHLQRLTTAGKLGKKQWGGCAIPETINTSAWREKARKQIKLVSWVPPDANWIKLNIDGQWSEAGSGAGGILRDEDANLFRCFKTNISATSPLDAELQAISLGLDMAGERGQRIWLEVGRSEIVDLLRAKK